MTWTGFDPYSDDLMLKVVLCAPTTFPGRSPYVGSCLKAYALAGAAVQSGSRSERTAPSVKTAGPVRRRL